MNGHSEQSTDRVHNAFTITFCIVILLPACLYGAVDPVLNQATAMVAFFVLAAAFFFLPAPSHLKSKIVFALAVTTLALLYALIQAARFPGNPFANSVWSLPISTPDGRLSTSISMSPQRTMMAIVPIAHAGMAFAGALWLAKSDRQPLLFLKTFTVVSGVIAILAITQFEVAPRWLIAIPKAAYLDSLTTPFVNRNTAATFYGLAALVALITCLRSLTAGPEAPTARTRNIGAKRLEVLLLCLCGIAALTALILTRSRGGLLATFIAFAFYIPALALISQRNSTNRPGFGETRPRSAFPRFALVIVILVAMVTAFLVLGQRQLLRMDVEGVDQARLCILPQVVALARDNLTWGTGLGTFEQAFNAYRDPQCGIYGRWLSAHNVYLDIVVTTGLPGLILTVVVLIYLASVLIGGTRRRRRQRGLPLGGLSALILVATHSLVDFSLEVPGFAVPFAAVLGACIATCTRTQLEAPTAKDGAATSRDAAQPKARDWWNDPAGEDAPSTRPPGLRNV